ncbi:MAG TPA: hypothetical protein QF873_01420 [Patescibacteria group bacterium]|nr:hypothetical protein [Patescibacteria group bacterium]
MDNRDERLLVLLESGADLDELTITELIGVLSSRRLGPNTIRGTQIIHIDMDDPEVIMLHKRSRSAEVRAFELIRLSRYYRENEHPLPLDPVSARMSPERTFRDWVDCRIEAIEDIASGRYDAPHGDC